MIKRNEETQASIEKESTNLANDSKETYEKEALEAENKFLNEVNTDTRAYLEQRQGQFEANRDAAWTQLQDMLNGKLEEHKGKNQNEMVDQAFTEETERDRVKRSIAEGREDVAASAETRAQENINNGIKADFAQLLQDNPNITEQEIRDFFKEHENNPVIREYARKVINTYLSWESKQGFQNLIDEMRAEAEIVKSEIKGEINKSFADLHKELFNPKLSRREQARRTEMEQEERTNKAAWNKGMYGEKDSQDYLLKDVFDEFTKFVPVVWGDKQGMIYRDPKTQELIFREGGTNKEFIVSEEVDNKVYRDTKGQFTNGPTLGYLDMLLLRDANLDINIEADGRTFEINGEFYNNLFSDPGGAIEYDAEANVVSVTLTKWDGTKITFTSPSITYEIADVIETLEAVKRSRFRELVQNDFMIMDHKGEEYIITYGQTDLFTETLIARDQNGNVLTGELNATVLRHANALLSSQIQQEINNLKTKYNETINAQPDAAGRLTKNLIQQDEVGPSQTSERAAKQQEAFTTAEGTTSNTSPADEQSKESLEEQTILIENSKEKVEENNLDEKATPNPENPAVSQNNEKLEIIDSTSNQKSGQTSKEKSEIIVTEDNPTNTTIRVLRKTFPQAWAPQHMSNVSQFGEYQSLKDSNGNLIEILYSPTGIASNMVYLDELTGPQLEALEKGDSKFTRLYVFKPLLDQAGKIKKEGTKVLESEELVEFQMKRGDKLAPAVRVQIKDDAIKSSDIFDNKLLNSPELGVGTKVILRVEKSWPYFKTTEPGQGVVTVRLASNPDIILTQLSSADKALGTNGVLRKKINTFMKENPGKDIPATIAGKTAGYFINLKHDGKSIQQPLSVLGDDILLGVDLGGQGVKWNNTNENNFESEYTEQGRVYVRIKSANGIGHPARVQTSNLTDDAVKFILSTLTSNEFTAEEKRLLVEQLVYVPRGSNADAQFKLGSKTNKTFAADFDVTMDNFVIKFPFRGKVIGIQYNMEGREGNTRNNLQSALEGGDFLYKEYDEQGNVVDFGTKDITQPDTKIKKNTLRNSAALVLAPTEISDALTEHLKGKKFNIQKHKINTKEEYNSPLREQSFSSYDKFLIEMNILTTDIPGKGQQKVNHSRIYLDVPSTVFTPGEKQVPEFLENKEIKLIPVPEPDPNDVVGTSFEDLMNEPNPEVKKVDPTKDDEFDVKLRQYEQLEGNYDIISDTEKAWVLERFGEEALDIVNRAKYMTLKDGRQAWGYYHKGLMTVAEGATTGTAYWEAFRRIYDLHLTPDEKTAIEMEAISKWNVSGENIETRLAEEFMNYQLTENETGLGATIKKFFRELLYQIKNMLGMRSEIEYLFRDLNTRDYTKYTAKEAKELSQARVKKLREKKGYNSDQTKEIVGNINLVLSKALKAKYAKMALDATGVTDLERSQIKEGWKEALTKPSELKGAYESIRQQWENKGKSLLENETTKDRGENVINVTKPDVWYDVTDELGNVISPGFQSLAVRGLRSQFGIKYKIRKGGEINYDTAEVEEALTEEQLEQLEIQPVNKERIFGMNFYNTPVKQTLAREIKFELGFIVERDSEGNVIYGDVLGMPKYMAFDEVYAYLSVNLANSPQGKVIAKLESLAENGHKMMDQVLKIYGESNAQFQNKFVSHFNKQNIRFETVIYKKDGVAKIVETNRNGLENQIVRKWIDTRDQTSIYSPTTGKEDALSGACYRSIKSFI